jgi:hypothetical protein
MAKQEVVAAGSDNQAPALFIDEEMMTGPSGFENVSASDILIPRLTILQKMSPQIDKSDPAYIPGAEYGDFADTGTGEVFKESITVVPVFYAMVYLEWAPRGSGKGLVANHGTDASCLKNTTPDEKRRLVLPNGNYIAETATYYVLNLTANRRRSFIPMTSTQLKHARRWTTLLISERLKRPDGTEFQPPMWYRSWNVSTVEEKNNDGAWKSWKFTPGDPILALDPTKQILREAREFYEQARDGIVRGDVTSDVEEMSRSKEEIPF